MGVDRDSVVDPQLRGKIRFFMLGTDFSMDIDFSSWHQKPASS